MARNRLSDKMQNYPFWLVDIQPNLNPPFFALSPMFGFRSVTGMSLEAETESYRPLNSHYSKPYVTGATVGAITLERGASWRDTDFYRWVERTITGTDAFRRNLLLIHHNTLGMDIGGDSNSALFNFLFPSPTVVRMPGRAWLLYGCIPQSYQPGDLDATSSDVTMQSLTIQPQSMVEVALGAIF